MKRVASTQTLNSIASFINHKF